MKTTKIVTIATLLAALASPVLAAGDADKGAKTFKKCKACHSIGEDAKNKVGPVLTGIIGKDAGANPDFKYSKGMIAAAEGGLVWSEENLATFLTKPKAFVKGTKMGFAGLKKESDIENVLAYIATFE